MCCTNSLLGPYNFTQGHLMKIEWLAADVAAVQTPDRAEHAILGVFLARRFLANSGCIYDKGASL